MIGREIHGKRKMILNLNSFNQIIGYDYHFQNVASKRIINKSWGG